MRKLGEGGMSIVYLAEDMEESGRYAVKVLSPSLTADENAMARLRREAALGMQLEHPNVCHIVRLGDAEDGTVYAVMPFIEGELLADRRHRLGVLPLRDVVPWVSDIAAGLDRAHRLGIVHRDLKPENVMITHTAPEARERAVVMDFGLAKAQRAGAELERLTSTGIILGTPEFMSPEQLRGKPVDARTDVYALALIVYELLTGRLPFAGRTQQEMMIARLRSEPTPLRQQRPDLGFSEAVERVLARGMARESEKRYQSAPEMAQALEAATGESA
jgi:serine/threonine protein kinase